MRLAGTVSHSASKSGPRKPSISARKSKVKGIRERARLMLFLRHIVIIIGSRELNPLQYDFYAHQRFKHIKLLHEKYWNSAFRCQGSHSSSSSTLLLPPVRILVTLICSQGYVYHQYVVGYQICIFRCPNA